MVQSYQPTKYSTPVQIYTSVGGIVYKELGAELKVTEALPIGPVESFQQLLVEQPRWIRDLVQLVQFAPDKGKYNIMEKTIEDVLRAHDEDGYLIAVSDGLVKHMHQMSFGWVLSTADGVHLVTSSGGCDGRGSSLRAEAVGMLSISLVIVLMAKYSNCTNIKIVYVSDNKGQLVGGKFSTASFRDTGWCTKAIQKRQKED